MINGIVSIDPPSGWKFGFPKSVSLEEFNDKKFDFREWLLSNNYPEEDIELAFKYSRFWTTELKKP